MAAYDDLCRDACRQLAFRLIAAGVALRIGAVPDVQPASARVEPHAGDTVPVAAAVVASGAEVEYRLGPLCRSELLVEVEGIHVLTAADARS